MAVGQVRFILPGLVADARGVASGPNMAARFASLDRVVWFLRLLSAAADLDDCWSGMRLVLVRTPLGLREMLVLVPVGSTEACDQVAQAARTAGGQCATGASRHFVEYRDRQAPLGYDVTAVSRESADFLFYGMDQVFALQAEGERSLVQLLLGLDLLRRPEGRRSIAEIGPCTVTARRGLGLQLCEYLVRMGVAAKAALCEPAGKSAFGLSTGFWVFRIDDLPPRLFGLMSETPGLALYLPVTDGVAVAAGYRHLVNLAACRVLFPDHHLLLLSPRPMGPIVLDPAPRLTDVINLLPLPHIASGEPAAPAHLSQPKRLDVPLRLVFAPGAPARPKAAYLSWSQVGWLRRLCQALPAHALRGHQVALLEDAVLVVAADELAALPFGQLLDEAAPGVLVPSGMRLVPAVAPEALAEKLGAGAASWLVFPKASEPPLRILPTALRPLDHRILAELSLDVRPAPVRPSQALALEKEVAIEPDALGPFSLWGLDRK
ncbi:MAG TPA: hypothetical protein VF518_15390 [Polyangia bacterium]